MITDPNYVRPAHLTSEYILSLDADSARMIIRELSGASGNEPESIVSQITDHIYFCVNDCPNETGFIY